MNLQLSLPLPRLQETLARNIALLISLAALGANIPMAQRKEQANRRLARLHRKPLEQDRLALRCRPRRALPLGLLSRLSPGRSASSTA